MMFFTVSFLGDFQFNTNYRPRVKSQHINFLTKYYFLHLFFFVFVLKLVWYGSDPVKKKKAWLKQANETKRTAFFFHLTLFSVLATILSNPIPLWKFNMYSLTSRGFFIWYSENVSNWFTFLDQLTKINKIVRSANSTNNWLWKLRY